MESMPRSSSNETFPSFGLASYSALRSSNNLHMPVGHRLILVIGVDPVPQRLDVGELLVDRQIVEILGAGVEPAGPRPVSIVLPNTLLKDPPAPPASPRVAA